jgi:hypothetical protein
MSKTIKLTFTRDADCKGAPISKEHVDTLWAAGFLSREDADKLKSRITEADNASMSWAVPPRGKSEFLLQPNTRVDVNRVEVSPKSDALRLVLTMPDGKNLDTGRSEFPLHPDGTPKSPLVIDPTTLVGAVVHNASDKPARCRRVVLTGHTESCETMVFAIAPMPKQDKRFAIKACGRVDVTMEVGIRCRVARVAIRSDSDADVMVSELQFGNVHSLVGLDVPVEYFAGDGAEVRSPILQSYNRVSLVIDNTSGEDRWIEVDVHVEPVSDEQMADELRREAKERGDFPYPGAGIVGSAEAHLHRSGTQS